jgi:hypothetical protein
VRAFTEALKVSFIAPTHLGSASQNSSSYITSTSDCKFPQIFCSVSICCICFTGFLKRFNFSGHCGHFSFYNWLVIFLRASENTFFKFLLPKLLCYSEQATDFVCFVYVCSFTIWEL